MKVTVGVSRRTPDDVADRIVATFEQEGVPAELGAPAAIKADVDALYLAIDFALGAAAGGLMWDAEKEALRRGLHALKQVVGRFDAGGVTTIRHTDEAVVYLMPGGPDSDAAIDAMEPDYESHPGRSIRVWDPVEGWISTAELNARIVGPPPSEPIDATEEEAWVEYWAERGRQHREMVEKLQREAGE